MTNVVTRAMEMAHATDPREEIMDEVRPYVNQIEIGGCDILLAVYVRGQETKTKGGIILSDKSRDEDLWQSKAALILQMGPLAFTEDRGTDRWFNRRPRVGDWGLININDSFPILLGKRMCRLIEDKYLRAVISRPDLIF